MSISSRRIRQETSLDIKQAKEAAAAAERQLRNSKTTGGSSVPQKIDISGGGKGGTVLLIVGTLFIGYLYFTRRLTGVLAAIQSPIMAGGFTNTTNSSTPPTGNTQYGPPNLNPYAGFIQVTLNYPPNYNLPPETIKTDPQYCRSTVYAWVLGRTGSPTVAASMSQTMCPPSK